MCKKLIQRGVRVLSIGFAIAGLSGLRVAAVTFNFDQTLSGTAPVGASPWLTAAFNQAGVNTVELTLSAPGLTGNESVNQWYFNFNPELNLSSLVFNQISSTGDFGALGIQTGANAFKPNGDGKYDILFDFATAKEHFGSGDSITIDITGINGLSAGDFLFYNTPCSGYAPLYSAVFIQTIGESVIIDTPPQGDAPSVPDGFPTAIFVGLTFLGIHTFRKIHRTNCGDAIRSSFRL